MTDQEELFRQEAEESEPRITNSESEGNQATVEEADSAEGPIVTAAEAEEITPPGAGDIGGGGIADGEVRAVEQPPQRSSSKSLLLVLLLVAILLGGGFYLLNNGLVSLSTPEVETVAMPTQVPIKMPIERPVEEVLMQPKTVAAAGSEQPVTETTANPSVEPKPVEVKPDQAKPDQAKPDEAPSVNPNENQPAAMPYAVLIGPYLNSEKLKAAATQLHLLGIETEQTQGRGLVTMIRLLEGVYPPDQAHRQLEIMKKSVKSAFLLPAGEKLALYAGSFADPARADQFSEQLAQKGIKVRQVASDIEMNGKMLSAVQPDRESAEKFSDKLSGSGFKTRIVSH